MKAKKTNKNWSFIAGSVLSITFILFLNGLTEAQLGPWTYTSPLINARGQPGTAVYDGYIYVVGGANTNGNLDSVEYAPIINLVVSNLWLKTNLPDLKVITLTMPPCLAIDLSIYLSHNILIIINTYIF